VQNLLVVQAEIIAIGDEILIGQTIDTNSAFIATQLNMNGISVKQKRVIADDRESIIEGLDTLFDDTKIVIMTGGLGPTSDDITKKTLADYFGGELVFHEDVFDHIKELFATFGREPKESNKGQAYLPDSCEVLPNKIGTASGMHFAKDGRHFFSLPGVPYEAQHLIGEQVMPWIKSNLQPGTVVHRTLLTQGVPESILAERLEDWASNLPDDISLAYLPSPGVVRLRLTCYSGTEVEARKRVDDEVKRMYDILGLTIFGEDTQTLPEVVGHLLKQRGETVVTAESCTGGSIAAEITSVAGSSDYFLGGIVSYSNQLKMNQLGVKAKSLKDYGAVSEEVVKEMAEGARKVLGSTWAVSSSGVAGPGGGTEEKPVGTVWIGVAGPIGVKARKFRFGNNRARNIQRSKLMALDMLRRTIQKNEL